MEYEYLRDRFTNKFIPDPNCGCWLWIGRIESQGYGTINHGKARIKAHRLSYLLHNGDIPNELCVLHKCDIRNCVNPNHLFLGTREENNKDRNRKGRDGDRRGIRNYKSKLNPDIAKKIKAEYKPTKGVYLARKFNVHSSTIYRIVHNTHWACAEENTCSSGVCGI